jgi:hypothetical protein
MLEKRLCVPLILEEVASQARVVAMHERVVLNVHDKTL